MSSDQVTINIQKSDALVLFEFLSRELMGDETCDRLKQVTEDDSELGALSALLGCFERQLVEPFSKDYAKLLDDARKDCKERYGSFE